MINRQTLGQCVFDRVAVTKPRPQLIDQRRAFANLSSLIDTGQRVPQCQKPLAVERGGVQFLLRRDDNLAVTDLGRRLAAQCDAVIADDVGAHGWVLLIGPAACWPPVTPLTLSSPPKATPLWIILWRCSATAENEIACSELHEREQRQRREDCMQLVMVGDIEHTDVRVLPGDAP
jgi:hypothetical protein